MTSPKPAARKRSPLLRAAIVALIVVVAGGGFGVWYLFFRSSGPPPVDLANVPLASASVATAGAGAGSATATVGTQGRATAAPSSAGETTAAPGGTTSGATGSLDGTWKVDASLGSGDTGSFVGYRAQEQLASIGANVAVGRTSSVTGTFTLKGTTVSAASFTADLSTLKSDSDMRDGMIRRIGLESSQFPTATFELASPIDLGSLPADGTVAKVTASGKLTVHGVTKDERIALQAKRSATVIAIAGSLDVTFADFGMQTPTSSIALSVANPVTIEFQLLFSKQ